VIATLSIPYVAPTADRELPNCQLPIANYLATTLPR
jgi:hypothetical protein